MRKMEEMVEISVRGRVPGEVWTNRSKYKMRVHGVVKITGRCHSQGRVRQRAKIVGCMY